MIELRLAPDLLARIRASERRYDEQAYVFVLESIEYLQTRLPVRRHVSGSELALACRDFALDQFGLMARQVLEHWGVRGSGDIGRIVFTLVRVDLLSTQPQDREEDFHGVFDFADAFSDSYAWRGLGTNGSGWPAADPRTEGA